MSTAPTDPCPGPGWEPNGDAWKYTGAGQRLPDHELTGETQASIGRWAKETFPGGDDQSPVHALRMLDEAIEFCRAAGASWAEISKLSSDAWIADGGWSPKERKPDPAALAGEAADVAITLMVLCERRGINLGESVNAKMAVNRKRRWKSNGDGTGRHIKEGEEA